MFRNSYYKKIRSSFILVVLLPVLILSVFASVYIKNTTLEKISITNQSVLNVMATNVNKKIEDLVALSISYTTQIGIQDYLRAFSPIKNIDNYHDYLVYENVQNSIDRIMSNTLISDTQIFLVNNEGFLVSNQSVDSLQQDWNLIRNRTVEGKRGIQWIGIPNNHKPLLSNNYYLAKIIFDPVTNKKLGTLYIGISMKYFDTMFSSTKSGSFALLDKDGHYIFGKKSLLQEHPSRNSSYAIRNDSLLPVNDWKLIYVTPEMEFLVTLTKSMEIMVVFFLVILSLFLLISLFLAKKLNNPIEKLHYITKQFSQRNFNARYQITGNDEINQLGKTINEMLDEIQQLIINIEAEQKQKRELELKALFAQIRPHFLFNTLNSIKCSLSLSNDHYHSSKIHALMSLLRAYMKIDEYSTLENECKLLDYYVEIMKIRTDMNIKLDFELNGLEEFKIPILSLQPLVENSIVHGFSSHPQECRIRVTAIKDSGLVKIKIIDNGIGVEDTSLIQLNKTLENPKNVSVEKYTRVGLLNILERLRLTYSEQVSLRLENKQDGGVISSIVIPYSM